MEITDDVGPCCSWFLQSHYLSDRQLPYFIALSYFINMYERIPLCPLCCLGPGSICSTAFNASVLLDKNFYTFSK